MVLIFFVVFVEDSVVVSGFRPLTGIMVLIKLWHEAMQEGDAVFPSPYGDYGSYQKPLILVSCGMKPFPSPYGDYGSYPHPL